MDNKTAAGIQYTLDYRNVKHLRLEFKTGTLLLILPKHYKSEKQTLEKYQKWIQKKQLTINKALEEAKTKAINKTRTEKELRTLVTQTAQNYQNRTQHKNKQNLLQKNENKMGQPQQKQKPNHQYTPKVPARKHN